MRETARRGGGGGSVPRATSLAGRAPTCVPLSPLAPRSAVSPHASMQLRWTLCAAALLAAAAGARRSDQDFEFEEAAAELSDNSVSGSDSESVHARRPRRYVYDPHNSLCGALVCKKRELCLLRDAFTALCANKKDIVRKGDIIVSAGGAGGSNAPEEELDDVFYETGAGGAASAQREALALEPVDSDAPDRCVGCGSGMVAGAGKGMGGFLCGSDNRTYSSLCRLDLHNCVRRRKPAVQLACHGFCPCRAVTRRRPSTARREWRRRKAGPAGAEGGTRSRLTGSSGCALDKMANRLLDWFSVLMEEAQGSPPSHTAGFPAECKPEVRWMFAHLDTDEDGLLSGAELYALRHSERERCLRPFLAGCGGGRDAWCACLARAARPCTALARAHAGAAARGGYVPSCDTRGYYRPRQCHAALGVCWCVDAHGAERAGSRTRGEPDCSGAAPGADDEDGAGAGSGDAEPRY